MKNISEMFFYAQKAVLYPEDPLYSQDTKEVFTRYVTDFLICSIFQRTCLSSSLGVLRIFSNLADAKPPRRCLDFTSFFFQLTELCSNALTRIFKVNDSVFRSCHI